MWTRLRQALSASIDLFLPPACLLCSQPLPPASDPQSFCEACRSDLPSPGKSCCSRCAQPLNASASTHICGTCLTRTPAFSRVHAACAYQGNTKEAIHHLKYRDQVILAQPLGQLLLSTAETSISNFKPDAIIPVPLHSSRLRSRGYNQALEIARPLAHKLRVPLDSGLLQRTRKTRQQQGLSAIERRDNLRDAFALTKATTARKVLLVDDVMTTGETVRECCRVLCKGGISEVQVAVIGRA